MIKLISFAMMALFFSCAAKNYPKTKIKEKFITSSDTSIYQFKIEGLDGGIIDFSTFRGKKILIVNTASKCGFTPQFTELEELYKKYQDKLVIIGFPANDFGEQEPGTNEEIKEFCKKNYGVSFPMSAKISIRGDHMAPIYKWLTDKERNGVMDAKVKWNFYKFLIDENGRIVAKFTSDVTPMSEEITKLL